MPQKVVNEAGETIEVATQEEIEAQKEEAAEKARQDAEANFNNERADHEAEKKALEAKIEAEQSKQQSLSGLRHKTKAQEAELEASAKREAELQKQRDETTAKLQEYVVGGDKRTALETLSGGDAELKKAAEDAYKLLQTMPENSKESVEERVKTALAIARAKLNRPEPLDAMQQSQSYGGGGKAVQGRSKSAVTPEVQQLGEQRFGLTPDDFQKHGGAPTSTSK